MLAKIWNYKTWIKETRPDVLTKIFDNMLRESGFTVLEVTEHYFKPQGYTRLYLLCESHFAVHTFPERKKKYIELSSCNKQMFDKCVASAKKFKETCDGK